MKKQFLNPEINIELFASEDFITTSSLSGKYDAEQTNVDVDDTVDTYSWSEFFSN